MKVKIEDGDKYSKSIELESDYNLNKGDKITFIDENYFHKTFKVIKKHIFFNADGSIEMIVKVRKLKDKN
jgi:hypothetical protein